MHTDRGPAFHYELVEQLLQLSGVERSLATAYSKEENAIVERANQEVLRHLNAWSYDQLPMVQKTVEKTTTGVTPAELILNNSISLSSRILAAPVVRNSSACLALSDTMDTWMQKQHTLIKAAQANQRSSDPRITYLWNIRE